MTHVNLTELELIILRTRDRIKEEMIFYNSRERYVRMFDIFADEVRKKQRENEAAERR